MDGISDNGEADGISDDCREADGADDSCISDDGDDDADDGASVR